MEIQNGDQIDNTIPARANQSLPVVVLGGSAGSIPALRLFLENTPSHSGFAYVVVLHLAPDQESSMPALLQRHTSMPVSAAANGAKLEANCVYVIPPGKQLTAADGHLRLTDLHLEPGKRVAVDLFFRSLADTHGPQATAVVLSGADGDGAIGLKRIKELGGLTIAQLPEEAEQSSMPRSAIATGMVEGFSRSRKCRAGSLITTPAPSACAFRRKKAPSRPNRSECRTTKPRPNCARCSRFCGRVRAATFPIISAPPSCAGLPGACRSIALTIWRVTWTICALIRARQEPCCRTC